jgi:hypothetical protein
MQSLAFDRSEPSHAAVLIAKTPPASRNRSSARCRSGRAVVPETASAGTPCSVKRRWTTDATGPAFVRARMEAVDLVAA